MQNNTYLKKNHPSGSDGVTTEQEEQIQTIILDHLPLEGPLLPILHALQNAFGHIPPQALPMMADQLRLSTAEIHGVIGFYHHFKPSPAGRHRVQICRAEACQAMGSRELEAHAKRALGIDYHQTTADQQITLEPVYCLGNCACSPSVRIDDQVYARVTPERLDSLLEPLLSAPIKFVS